MPRGFAPARKTNSIATRPASAQAGTLAEHTGQLLASIDDDESGARSAS